MGRQPNSTPGDGWHRAPPAMTALSLARRSCLSGFTRIPTPWFLVQHSSRFDDGGPLSHCTDPRVRTDPAPAVRLRLRATGSRI